MPPSPSLCRNALHYLSMKTSAHSVGGSPTPYAPYPPMPWAALLQVGPASDLHLRSLLDLCDQLLLEPVYDTLRTKQQLGYTVGSGARLTHGVLGFCVSIVSAAHPAETLEARAEEFLASYAATLQVSGCRA